MILYENKGDSCSATEINSLTYQPHLHHHIELIYVETGSVNTTVDGTTYTVDANSVIFIFPNQIHEFVDLSPLSANILIISPDEFPEFQELFKTVHPTSPIIPNAGDEIRYLFHHLIRSATPDFPYSRQIVRGYGLTMMSLLLPRVELIPHRTQNLSTVQKVLLYCDTHYTEELTLDFLAKKFGVSRFYISHIFTQQIKSSFNSYINFLRIQAAKQQLSKTDLSITEIAGMVGYNNMRSFNRCFIATEGCSPTAYRRQKQFY